MNLRCAGSFLGDRFRRFLSLRGASANKPTKAALRVLVAGLAELWKGLVFFSATYWAPTRNNVVARLGLRSVFAFMFHPFYVPVAQKVLGLCQNHAPDLDDLAWLPFMFLFQFFVSRQPILRVADVTEPFALWVKAPRDSPRLMDLRLKVLSVAVHPQLVLVYMLLLAVVARVYQVAS